MTIHPQAIFEQFRPPVSASLSSRILSSIDAEISRREEWRAFLAKSGVGVSGVIFLMSVALVGKSFVSSDFWQLMMLVFTDFSSVVRYSEDFVLSLAETFPAASSMLLLAPAFLVAISLVLRSRYLTSSMGHGHWYLEPAH